MQPAASMLLEMGVNLVHRWRNFLATIRNAIDYSLRRRIAWRRPIRKRRNELKENLFEHLSGTDRAQAQSTAARLKKAYRLDALFQSSTRTNYCENLFYLEILEAALTRMAYVPPEGLYVGDVGPSHWFYVRALYQLLRWWKTPVARTVQLHGFEIDPYRVYADFHSRMDHAEAQMEGLEGVVYHPEGIENHHRNFDLVLQLFPFVFVADHLDWGLPRQLFSPEKLVAQVWRKIKPGGILVVVNQGEAEHIEEQRILKSVGAEPKVAFRHDTLLFTYELPRYVLVARKDDESG
jgi:SAM-dependent methyltransferase